MFLAFAGCSMDLGSAAPWVDASDIQGPLAPEVSPSLARAAGIGPSQVRVVSFNVEKGADVEALAEAFGADSELGDASILLLQEIESHPDEGGSRASRLAAALGMGYAYAPERVEGDGTHGTAILSRWPLDRVQVMALPFADLAISDAPRIAIAAEVQVGDQILHVIALHLDTRLNATQRILQMRPAVLDAPWPTIVGGDFNMNTFVWAVDTLPQLLIDSVVDSDQAPVIDDYMRHVGYETPTANLGPTQHFAGLVESRLDAIYVRGVTSVPGAVDRAVTLSDHWPVWVDLVLGEGPTTTQGVSGRSADRVRSRPRSRSVVNGAW